MLDPTIVTDAVRAIGRDDLELGVAGPEEYGAIEEMSRASSSAEVFSPLTAALIEWFVDRNPCGPGFVVLARDPSSRLLAGHFVFYRWRLVRRVTGGGLAEVPVFLYVRLYVRPEYRRRGVFSAMTAFGLEVARRLGVGLAYTAPNPRSSPGFVKFGMERRGPLPVRVRPSIPGWGLMGRLPKPSPGLDVEVRSEFDASFQGAMGRDLPPAIAWWGDRTPALLNWRYVERPDARYEIRYARESGRASGFLVTRRMRIKGLLALVVCDFWCEPRHDDALRVALLHAQSAGERTALAVAIGSDRPPQARRALRRAGFVAVPAALLPQPIVIFGGGLGNGPARVDLPELDAWHLTPGDWDVF
jgi:GNAT superfamily N-acetyltransferase